MGTESIHDKAKWRQPMKEFVMTINDFRDGYKTLRYECLGEECTAQSLIFETTDYVHVSGGAFKYVSRAGGTSR